MVFILFQGVRGGDLSVHDRAACFAELAEKWSDIVTFLLNSRVGVVSGTSTHQGMEDELSNDRLLCVRFAICGRLLRLCEYALDYYVQI